MKKLTQEEYIEELERLIMEELLPSYTKTNNNNAILHRLLLLRESKKTKCALLKSKI